MSAGNPFGLAEISHYGTMQRVGGKAAGFINKKFFHPSSFRNQEKLWKAQTAHAVEMRKQADMEKRRDEERQVEELRKQMYLAGQAKATDFLSFTSASASSSQSSGRKSEQHKAFEEQRRRKALLLQEHAAQQAAEGHEEAGEEAAAPPDLERARGAQGSSSSVGDSRTVAGELVPAAALAALVKSRYPEDKLIQGHGSVWGSWFTTTEMRWGFLCCKSTDKAVRCPLAPEEEEETDAPKAKRPRGEPRGKKRRRGGRGAGAEGAAAAPTDGPGGAVGGEASEAGGEVAAADVVVGTPSGRAEEEAAAPEGGATSPTGADAADAAGDDAIKGSPCQEGGIAASAPSEGIPGTAEDMPC